MAFDLIPNLHCEDNVQNFIVILIAVIGAVTTFLTVKSPKLVGILRTIYAILGFGALVTSQIWLVLYGLTFPFGLIGAISAVLGLHALVLPELRFQILALQKIFYLKKHPILKKKIITKH